MSKIAESVLELIGDTPLLRLNRVVEEGSADVLGKLESLNPGGSVKDRVALAMVKDAEAQGLLGPGSTIVEATSGNSGLSLAMVAVTQGYRIVIFMPENAPAERRKLLLRYGVDVRPTPTHQGMEGAEERARAMVDETPGCLRLDLFKNPAVVRVHRDTTAQEIIEATDGNVDAFVAGVGTGGTITGAGGRLKETNPSLLLVAVEPESSKLLSGGNAGHHGIPGIGADFIPPLLDRSIIDEIISVEDVKAARMSQLLAKDEGLLVGVSSGANVVASLDVAKRLGPGKTVVTMLPDTGERYLNYPI